MADGRVNGSLNLSRALGDLEYKQTKELGPEEQVGFLFLAGSCRAARIRSAQFHGPDGTHARVVRTAAPACLTPLNCWVQMVTAMPEIRRQTLQPGDEFLILACDGIWDVLTNQEVRGGWSAAWAGQANTSPAGL